jgi:prophage antirepressor-like protein
LDAKIKPLRLQKPPTQSISSRKGRALVFGSDICRVLNLASSAYAYKRLDEGDKRYVGRAHLGLPQGKEMLLVSESGLYKLAMHTDKKEALEFPNWIASG